MPTGKLVVSDDADIGELLVVKLIQRPARSVICWRMVFPMRDQMRERVPCSRKRGCRRKTAHAM